MDTNNSTENNSIVSSKTPSRLNKFTALFIFAVSTFIFNGCLVMFAFVNLGIGAMATDKYNKWIGTPPSQFLTHLPYVIAALTFIICLAGNIFFWVKTLKRNKDNLSKGGKWALSGCYLVSISGIFVGSSALEELAFIYRFFGIDEIFINYVVPFLILIISIIFALIHNFYLKNKFEKHNVFRKMSVAGVSLCSISFFLIIFIYIYLMIGVYIMLSSTNWF